MPSWSLNNITAPDFYTASSTLSNLPPINHINIDVTNSSIYWSLQETTPHTGAMGGTWQQEVFMTPGSRTITRSSATGIRIRAAVAQANLPAGATQAQVTVEAVI